MRPVLLSLVLAVAGCSASSEPGDAKAPITLENAKSDPKVPATFGESKPDANPTGTPNTGAKPEPEPNFSCRLPAPVSSDDACTKDADCAPSVPCHARTCVAVGKATPRTPDTVCSMNIDCQSADVNACSCYQGRCALVPR